MEQLMLIEAAMILGLFLVVFKKESIAKPALFISACIIFALEILVFPIYNLYVSPVGLSGWSSYPPLDPKTTLNYLYLLKAIAISLSFIFCIISVLPKKNNG